MSPASSRHSASVRSRPSFLALVALGFAAACGEPKVATTGPAKVDLPTTDGLGNAQKPEKPTRQSPPSSGTSREAPFPTVAHSKLGNGMGVDVVTLRALPVVQVRVLVHAGSGYGPAPGIGELTAHMLKDGGTRTMASAEVLRRIESLGADLSVRSEPDATVIGIALTKDKVADGLAILSQVVREPRFDGEELKKLKARTIDEVEDTLRSSGSWTASWLVFHELYPEKSPYRTYGPLPSQIAKIDGGQVRDFHRRFFVPKNATLVVAGDIDEPTAKDLAQRNFGAWTGGEPPKVDFPAPKLPERTRVLIAHRPKSVQSDVNVAMLAPERKAERWAEVRVANQILGGGVASRLFLDVREQRSLAYQTRAQILEMAHGQQPLVVYAGTESSKTALAVTGLLDNLRGMKTDPPTVPETENARRFLSDVFAIRMETVGSIAEMVVTQQTFGLPDGYWDTYRKQLRATDAKEAAEMAAKTFTDKGLIVVSGDADVIGGELARFGDVTVFDPEKEFKVMKTLPAVSK